MYIRVDNAPLPLSCMKKWSMCEVFNPLYMALSCVLKVRPLPRTRLSEPKLRNLLGAIERRATPPSPHRGNPALNETVFEGSKGQYLLGKEALLIKAVLPTDTLGMEAMKRRHLSSLLRGALRLLRASIIKLHFFTLHHPFEQKLTMKISPYIESNRCS